MKKLLLILLICSTLLLSCSCGYLYIGDGWQDTPEKALAIEADNPRDGDSLTPVTLLDTWYSNGKAFMLFVAEAGLLTEVNFVTNKAGKYHFCDYIEATPDVFLVDNEGSSATFNRYGNLVFGYKSASVSVTINGREAQVKSYSFTCGGKEWNIDRFWLDDIGENDDVTVKYTEYITQ